MSFKQIKGSILYYQHEVQLINHLKPLDGHEWEGKLPGKNWGSRTRRDTLKDDIRIKLDDLQGDNCCFCGLSLYETSNAQIEHIAPKGKYPEFLFENQNLALACSYCNGFDKKGFKDTIYRYNPKYSKCRFKIVHPYFDNPEKHFSVAAYDQGKLILNYLTRKAKRSRRIFDLAGPNQTIARGKQYMYENLKFDEDTEKILQQILKQKHGLR